jgi:hypothetical protein
MRSFRIGIHNLENHQNQQEEKQTIDSPFPIYKIIRTNKKKNKPLDPLSNLEKSLETTRRKTNL